MVVGVEFELELLFGGMIANFEGGVEAASFTSTTTSYEAFADPEGSGLAPDKIFDSMGTGDLYGSVGFDPISPPGEIVMDRSPAAIFDMETSLAAGTPFMITGKMDTFDPAADALFEFMFGLTDIVVGGSPTGMPVPKLIITTAPIPAPGPVVLLGMSGLIAARRKRK